MNRKGKPPFPGIVTKPSVIPGMIKVLQKRNLPFQHLLDPDDQLRVHKMSAIYDSEQQVVVRQHKGTLEESRKSAKTVSNRLALWELITATTILPPMVIRAGTAALQLEPYGYDKRISKYTYLINIVGYGVWGMAEGDIP